MMIRSPSIQGLQRETICGPVGAAEAHKTQPARDNGDGCREADQASRRGPGVGKFGFATKQAKSDLALDGFAYPLGNLTLRGR
jgi:hypothetical protein